MARDSSDDVAGPEGLDAEDWAALKQLARQQQRQARPQRRSVLHALGVLGGAGGLAALGSQRGAAAVGTVGEPGRRVDVFAETVDADALTVGGGQTITDSDTLGGTSNWSDVGSIGLEPAGTGNAYYPMHVPISDGETFYVDAWFLRLDDETTDSNLEINLTDTDFTTKVQSETLTSDPLYTDSPTNVSYSPGDGSIASVHVQVENNGSTDYTDSSNPAILYAWKGHIE